MPEQRPVEDVPRRNEAFAARLQQHATSVEHHLAAILHRERGAPERLVAAMRHAVLGGGKRLRPFLVIESAALFDVDPTAALDVAAALECIHCYSLVHDDLPAMDNDELRRGQPTVWRAFDEWTAILAGDALLTLAFEIIACDASSVPRARKSALVAELASASGWAGMVGGQCIDLEADKLGEPRCATIDHIRRLQSMKTGALILFAVKAGAILGDAAAHERAALDRYGRAIGLAFQIADDMLDVEGSAEAMGKAAGKDAAAGKATLVGLLGLPDAKTALREAHAEALSSLGSFGAKAA
ncbi:MAG: polyprenyl synthetase family protein, partial [Hyphomicrobiaceae bacterium]